MTPSATIIYYTSNREHPDFETKIIETLKKNCNGLPIISISQKPLNLGKNICVGDVGASGFNMFRQVEIGLKACDTDFVISAEADCVYSPDYFLFRPYALDRCYRNSNLYVMPDHRSYFFKKSEGATHSQIIGRKFYLETLEKLFKNAPLWNTKEKNFPKERFKKDDIFDRIYHWHTKNPVFQIKTHRSMRYYTHSERIPVPVLPYWGDGKKIRNHYLLGIKEKWSNA